MRKRTKAREYVLQMLYQVDITQGNWQEVLENFCASNDREDISGELKDFSTQLLSGVVDHLQEIDKKISKYAANWQLERMAFVDRNIMRLGCFELLFRADIPPKVADTIETICNAHQLDGIICLTNCDKITPGMIMGVARLNIPAIIVTAGPMLSGRYNQRKLAFVHDTYEGMARAKKGDISVEELSCLEMEACPGAGSCQGLYTANTMACLTEAMGMSLPGCGTALAASAKKRRIAEASGERIVELVRKNIKPRDIITKKSFGLIGQRVCRHWQSPEYLRPFSLPGSPHNPQRRYTLEPWSSHE